MLHHPREWPSLFQLSNQGVQTLCEAKKKATRSPIFDDHPERMARWQARQCMISASPGVGEAHSAGRQTAGNCNYLNYVFTQLGNVGFNCS